jgi:hypothetical protein
LLVGGGLAAGFESSPPPEPQADSAIAALNNMATVASDCDLLRDPAPANVCFCFMESSLFAIG